MQRRFPRALLVAATSTYMVGVVGGILRVGAASSWALITSLGLLLLYAGVRHVAEH